MVQWSISARGPRGPVPSADMRTAMDHDARRQALRQRLAAAGLDALLITRLVNVRYLTGFTGSAGRLLVTADGSGDLVVSDGRYREQLAAETRGIERHESRGAEWLAERLGPRRKLGVESQTLSWDAARGLVEELSGVEVVPAPGHVEALRAVKDDGELAAIRRACAATDAAVAAVVAELRPGWTERDVARRLDDELRDRADGPAFETIVAAGPNSARPHHRPTARVVRPGDPVLMDLGAAVDGYAADLTRTIVLGAADPAWRALYDVVLDAQRAGVAAATATATAGDVDAACRERIAAAGLAEYFIHPTGHALGLEVHEEPVLREGATARLAAGMTVTVEPGVYVPGLGGVRIEDTIAVGPPGSTPEVLTLTPTDLRAVG